MKAVDSHELERWLIDEYGVNTVLEEIGIICRRKADYVRARYDDQILARSWELVSDAIAGAEAVATKELHSY